MTVRRLHWVAATSTPYWSYFLAALAADPGLDLTVHYASLAHPEYPWRNRPEDPFPHRVFRRQAFDLGTLRLALDRRQRVLVAGWETPVQVALLLELAALGRPYLFFTDTPVQRPRPPLRRIGRNLLARTVLRTASTVLTTGSPGVEALRAMGCPADSLVSLPYICDPEAFRRPPGQSTASDDGLLRVVSCGRLIPDKAYDVGLRAVAELKRAAPDVRFHYDIVGTGPEESRLRSLTESLGLVGEVRFPGWLAPEEVSRLLVRCDLFLHPATQEPYGVAVLEAMAAGAAVLGSSAAGAVRDRIVHGENGVVHAAGDAGDLSSQLIEVARDRPRIRCLGGAAAATSRAWPASRGVAVVKAALERTGPIISDRGPCRCPPQS